MPQQINLCPSTLPSQKRYFAAQAMVVSALLFVVFGGALCGVWVWNMGKANAVLVLNADQQKREIEALQAAIQRSQAAAAPTDQLLVQQLQERHEAVQQRTLLLQALHQGVFRPGWGHSDRLQLVARSIPDPVWVTRIRADESRFEVSGFTLDSAALNEWVSKLATSPLMDHLKLTDVKVENTVLTQASAPPAVGAGAAGPARALWGFDLVSLQPAPVAPAVAATGGKP